MNIVCVLMLGMTVVVLVIGLITLANPPVIWQAAFVSFWCIWTLALVGIACYCVDLYWRRNAILNGVAYYDNQTQANGDVQHVFSWIKPPERRENKPVPWPSPSWYSDSLNLESSGNLSLPGMNKDEIPAKK